MNHSCIEVTEKKSKKKKKHTETKEEYTCKSQFNENLLIPSSSLIFQASF